MDNRHDRHTRRPRPINQKERVALHEDAAGLRHIGQPGHGERDGTRGSLFDCCPKPLRSARLNLGVVGYFSEKLGFRLLEKPRSFH